MKTYGTSKNPAADEGPGGVARCLFYYGAGVVVVQDLHIIPALLGVQHTAGLAHPHAVAVAVGGDGKAAAALIIADIKGMAAQPEDVLPDLATGGDGIAHPHGADILAVGAGGALTAGAKTGNYSAITETAKKFVENIKNARQGA